MGQFGQWILQQSKLIVHLLNPRPSIEIQSWGSFFSWLLYPCDFPPDLQPFPPPPWLPHLYWMLVSVQRSLEIKTCFSIQHTLLNATEFTLIILIVDLRYVAMWTSHHVTIATSQIAAHQSKDWTFFPLSLCLSVSLPLSLFLACALSFVKFAEVLTIQSAFSSGVPFKPVNCCINREASVALGFLSKMTWWGLWMWGPPPLSALQFDQKRDDHTYWWHLDLTHPPPLSFFLAFPSGTHDSPIQAWWPQLALDAAQKPLTVPELCRTWIRSN